MNFLSGLLCCNVSKMLFGLLHVNMNTNRWYFNYSVKNVLNTVTLVKRVCSACKLSNTKSLFPVQTKTKQNPGAGSSTYYDSEQFFFSKVKMEEQGSWEIFHL